jgi:putative inorganic carbon (hco3(-)) transporter
MARRAHSRLRTSISGRILQFSARTLLTEKLNNWLGICLAGAIALLYAWLLSYDTLLGMTLFATLTCLFVAIICLTQVEIGFYLLISLSFFVYFFSSFFFGGQLPVGSVFDGLVVVNFLSLLIGRHDFKTSWTSFIKIPLVVYILLRFFFDIVEMFNPNSGGASATSFQGVRKFLEYTLILFTAYTLFDSYQRIRRYTIAIFIASTFCAIYGCIQEWHGLFDFELQPILADPHAFGLLFQNGEFKKFGTMSDPSAFGIMMAVCSTFFLLLAIQEKNKTWRATFLAGSIFMILAMGYSGTRTAYATLLAGIAFFILLNFDKTWAKKFGIAIGLVFLLLMFGPFSGIATIRRFRSTFEGSQDQSFKVRTIARESIQPYIWSHPIGGGLGTTGFNGAIEHPGHPLANFQPDSSYLTKATETGWIGLATILILYFWTLKVAIVGFFSVRHPLIKAYYAAAASSLFAFYIAEFAQIAIGGITDVTFYFGLVAIVLKLKQYEQDLPPA